MEEIFTYILNLNWQTVIAMLAIGWFFTKEIKSTLIKLESDVRAQGTRTDKLYEMYLTIQKELKDELLEMKKEQYEFMNEKRNKK